MLQYLYVLLLTVFALYVTIVLFYIYTINKYGHEFFIKKILLTEFKKNPDFIEIQKSEHSKISHKTIYCTWSEAIDSIYFFELLKSKLKEQGYKISHSNIKSKEYQSFHIETKIGVFSLDVMKNKNHPNSFLIEIRFLS